MPKSTTPIPKSTAAQRTPRKPSTTITAAPEANAIASIQTIQSTLTHDVIAARAYELFLSDGATHGHDVEHWLRAELELRARTVV
jgi:hypothetical protein